MRKHFLLLLLMTLLPLAGWANNYTVKIGAKAANIQFGVGTPTTATPDMFMVLDWNGCDDVDSRNFILGEIASNLSVTSQREAGSSLGNYAFTLSVTAPGYQQIGTSEDYYRVVVEDGSSSGTFKQVKNEGAPYLTSGAKATSLNYTSEGQSLLSTLPDAYFGFDYAGALVKGLPVEFRVEKGGDVVSDWSTNEPKATDAGVYVVKYRVKDDLRYTVSGGEETIDDIEIGKGTPVITTAPTFAGSTTFVAGSPVNLITNPGAATLGASMIFRYQKDGSDWSEWYSSENSCFTRSDAATFMIQYTTQSTSNLNPAISEPYSEPVEIVIAKADITTDDFTAPTAAALTYDGTDQLLVEGAATTGIDGTFTYATSEDGETWSDFGADVPRGTNAKPYYVKYKFTPTANYNAYEAEVENVKIARLSIVDGEGNLAAGFALSAANMEAANASVYTGTAIKPTVALRYKGAAMSHSVLDGVGDYARSYNNNINASDEAEIIFTAKNNFEGEYTQKFTINKADIANLNVTLAQDTYDYSAAANEPAVTTVKLGEYTFAADDYAVAYTNNTNAGTATVTVTPNVENFTAASTSVNFTINKATLYVEVANATKSFGQVDPTPAVNITGFEGNDEQTVDLTGAYTIGRTNTSEDPGTYTWAVTDNGLLTNYDIKDADPQGALTINSATVFIRPQDTEKTYGYELPELNKDAFEFQAAGLTTGEVTALTFTVTDNTDPENPVVKNEGDRLDVGTYTITASAATVSAGSYTFDYTTTATLIIAQKELTLTAKNQTIEYGGAASTDVVYEAGETQTVVATGRVGDDDLGITLEIAANATSIATHEGAITINVTNLNPNYVLAANNPVAGDLIITAPASPAITLTRVAKANIDNATVAQLIKDYDGTENVDVTIKFDDPGYNTLKPNKWYAFILPFKTDVKMISDAFGYAIVDLLNEGNTNTHRTVFSLKMDNAEIPANTPFIVKVWETINMENVGVTFNDVKIEAPATYDEIVVSDAAGNQFIGSYTGINGLGAYKPEYSGHVLWWSLNQASENDNDARPASDTGYLRQMSAFSYVPEDVAAHEFIIEELGGNTTVIRGINIDGQNISAEGLYNLNGMKLNSVPTQKGVYIQNGKKVVIK